MLFEVPPIGLSGAVESDMRVIPSKTGFAECDVLRSQTLEGRTRHRIKCSQRCFVAGQQARSLATAIRSQNSSLGRVAGLFYARK